MVSKRVRKLNLSLRKAYGDDEDLKVFSAITSLGYDETKQPSRPTSTSHLLGSGRLTTAAVVP